jgi:tetratricopeptide (TPR) repeat protein
MKAMRKDWRIGLLTCFLLLLTVGVEGAGWFDWEKAVSLYKQGQYREAIAEFERVIAEYPDHSDSWKFIGLSWFQMKEHERAIEPLGKALELKRRESRNDPELIRTLGQAHLALSRYEQSLEYLETITRLEVNVPANHYLLGVAYANLNRAEESMAEFRTALRLNPKDGETWYFLASQQYRAGKLAEAMTTLRQGLAIIPKSPEMLALLAESLIRNGSGAAGASNEKTAQSGFEEAVRTAQTLRTMREDAATLDLYGRALLAAGKYQAATQPLGRSIGMTPQPTAAQYFNLGVTYARLKSWNRAVELLLQADRLSPNDRNTINYLGYSYENLSQYQSALDAYTRAYELGGKQEAELKSSLDRVAALLKP